jgi:MGT family glycosyltransferase
VIVRDELDFGAVVVAETCRLPHAAVVVIAAGGFVEPELIAEPLALLRSEYGLTDDGLAMLHRHLTLVPVPPSFRNPLDPLPSTAHHVRPAVIDKDEGFSRPVPPAKRPPTVYFTLGTIFHQESGDLFQRVLSGLTGLVAEIVVTVGNEIDPAELGPQPPNVRIERFIPAGEILSRCDLVVSHGGSGTVVGALAFGVPQVVLPIGADQPLNADRCHDLGVAAVLNASTDSGQTIAEAARTVLEDRSYRLRASSLRDEIRSLPGSGQAASLLEHLATAAESSRGD